jgi:hypothetical protein
VDGRVVFSGVVQAISDRHAPLIFLLGILIFKVLTARRRYKSFGVKGLIKFQVG